MSLPPVEWFERWEALPAKAGQARRAAAAEFRDEVERRAASGTLLGDEQALLVLRREPWDCDRLGLEAAKLDGLVVQEAGAGQRLVREALGEARRAGFVHLCARLDTRDRLGARALQAAGFNLVDTVVTLGLDRPESWPSPAPFIRRAVESDVPRLGELSADAFASPADSFNRYINDPHLPVERVREVYSTWARTSLGGPAADLTLVSEEAGELTGFLTLVLPRAGVARVPLNAVDRRFRGRGLYRALVVAGANEAFGAGAKRLEVVTQLQQLAVQRTWWRLGAVASASATSWHCWLGG